MQLVEDVKELRKPRVSFSPPLSINLDSPSASQQRRLSPPQTPTPKAQDITPHSYLSKITYSENPLMEVWMMENTWLSIATPTSILSKPESLFLESRYQAGLVAIDLALSTPTSIEPCTPTSSSSPPNSTPASTPPLTQALSPVLHGQSTDTSTIAKAELINLHLLRSCALLASSQPRRALQAADIALGFAVDHEICYMICKSQLYRGLCLMKLERWKEASLSFTRAANIRGWAVRVKELKKEAERCAEGQEKEAGRAKGEIGEKDVLFGVWPGE